MKTKRILRTILVLLTFALTLESPAFAHPGKTDSNGGHTDHETGEYHYHHGYPAHDHYDMDGDGDIDCPYDFDDQTDRTPNSNDSADPTYRPKPTHTIPQQTSPGESGGNSNAPSWIAIILLCSGVVAGFTIIMLRITRKNKTTASSIDNKEPSNVIALASAREVAPESKRNAFNPERMCSEIWSAVRQFRNATASEAEITTDAYLWATFFYIATKHIRNQEIVDQIYLQFGLSVAAERKHYSGIEGVPLHQTMRSAYRKMAQILNSSRIDPRTDEGITSLWIVLRGVAGANGCSIPNSQEAFRSTAQDIRAVALKMVDVLNAQKPNQAKYSLADIDEKDTEIPT